MRGWLFVVEDAFYPSMDPREHHRCYIKCIPPDSRPEGRPPLLRRPRLGEAVHKLLSGFRSQIVGCGEARTASIINDTVRKLTSILQPAAFHLAAQRHRFGWLFSSLLFSLFFLTAQSVLADEPVPAEPFVETECISCHAERDPNLISQWRKGPHSAASGVGCIDCHADRHQDAGVRARKDQTCSSCHAGPASHSYTTSKHGIITRLEGSRRDWRQPLQQGKYRTPGCSYCHLHDGDHGNTMAPARGPAVRQWICTACHSPRYVREQFASGKRQLAIADLKLTEGTALIASALDNQTEILLKLQQSLIQHRQNVLLGVGHQSPDYQWWHGQPALDGDLIRIRDAVGKY